MRIGNQIFYAITRPTGFPDYIFFHLFYMKLTNKLNMKSNCSNYSVDQVYFLLYLMLSQFYSKHKLCRSHKKKSFLGRKFPETIFAQSFPHHPHWTRIGTTMFFLELLTSRALRYIIYRILPGSPPFYRSTSGAICPHCPLCPTRTML